MDQIIALMIEALSENPMNSGRAVNLALESRVLLVLDHKDYIGGDMVWPLVSFFGEGDASALSIID